MCTPNPAHRPAASGCTFLSNMGGCFTKRKSQNVVATDTPTASDTAKWRGMYEPRTAFRNTARQPIINPPQSAILGVHATKDRAVVENGQVVVRPMNYLAMSYDHRIIDGREAVLTLVAIKEALEDPARLLLDV